MSRSKFASFLTIATLAVGIAYAVPASAQESSGDRRVVERVQPTFPELAQRSGLSGTVKLKVQIAPDGKVKNVEVLGGNPVFVGNATESVKKWKWASTDHESTETVMVTFAPRT